MLALSCGLTSCGSPNGRRSGPPDIEPPQPPLTGDTVFFGGTIAAHAEVGPFALLRHPPGEGGNSGSNRPPRTGGGHAGGFSGGMSGGMGGMSRGGGGEHAGRGGGMPGEDSADAPRRAARGPAVQLPHQTLRISFTNTGPTPVLIAVTELRSPIGNFVPQPESLTLAPGGSGTLEPVSGDAGGTLESVDVTVTLKRDRISDTQVLHLQGAAPAAPRP